MKTGLLLTLTIGVFAIRFSCPAYECGNGGNTYWTIITTESSNASRTAAQDETNLLRSVGTKLYAWSKISGGPPLASRDFGAMLLRPVSFVERTGERRVILAGLVQEPGVVPGEGARLFALVGSRVTKLCIPWPDKPGDQS